MNCIWEKQRGDDVFRKVKVEKKVSVSKVKMKVRASEQNKKKSKRNSCDVRTHWGLKEKKGGMLF